MLTRKNIQAIWPKEFKEIVDFNVAEGNGLACALIGGLPFYKLSDVIYYMASNYKITMQEVIELIKIQEPKDTATYDIYEAMERLANGENPGIPATGDTNKDALALRTLATAYKDKTLARQKDISNKEKTRELLPKADLMDSLNKIADMYEERFGDHLFRKIQEVNGDYFKVRDLVGNLHDEVVQEINRIEESL